MKFYRAGMLAAVCAGAVAFGAASAGAANSAGVNMIYPPKLASDFDKDEITPAATAATTKVYVVPASRRSFYRWRYRHKVNCKIHQYYSFSRRGCGQRLYPF